MLRLKNLDNAIKSLMLDEFDRSAANRTLFVPNILTEEGQEDYQHLFRYAVLQANPETLADALIDGKLVLPAESPARVDGAAARPITRQVVEAYVKGEFNRLYCRAVCRVALGRNLAEVVVYQAEDAVELTPECSRRQGERVEAQSLFDALERSTLDQFLDQPADCPTVVLSVRLP
jgi:hypothetical protein